MTRLDEITTELFADRGIGRDSALALLAEIAQSERLAVIAALMGRARESGNEAMETELTRLLAAECGGAKH